MEENEEEEEEEVWCRYQPDGSVAAVVDIAHHRGGGHLRAQVVVCVYRQPEVAVHQSCEGQSLLHGRHLQLLGRINKTKHESRELEMRAERRGTKQKAFPKQLSSRGLVKAVAAKIHFYDARRRLH